MLTPDASLGQSGMESPGSDSQADVLLTHSYHLPYDVKQVRKMQPYPPIGTLYAAAALREKNMSVAVFDPMLEEPERGIARASSSFTRMTSTFSLRCAFRE